MESKTDVVHVSQSSHWGPQTSSFQLVTAMNDQGSGTTHEATWGQWGWGCSLMKARELEVETMEGCGWVQNTGQLEPLLGLSPPSPLLTTGDTEYPTAPDGLPLTQTH